MDPVSQGQGDDDGGAGGSPGDITTPSSLSRGPSDRTTGAARSRGGSSPGTQDDVELGSGAAGSAHHLAPREAYAVAAGHHEVEVPLGVRVTVLRRVVEEPAVELDGEAERVHVPVHHPARGDLTHLAQGRR